MKGYNELHLNEETVIEAIQFWLNSKMVVAPTVTGIKSSGYDGATFVVKVSSPENEKENGEK